MARYLSRPMPSTSNTDTVVSMGAAFGIKEVKELSSVMEESTGIPYGHMPVSFLKRRLAYIFRKHNIHNSDTFKQMLEAEDYREKLAYDFPVDTTEMFRDPGFWRYLRSQLKKLVINGSINVWFPEASSGEEVFSFLIIANELGIRDKFNIICQHYSAERLDEIKRGVLFNKNIQVNSSNYVRIEGSGVFEDYYALVDNVFILKESLLKNVQTVQGYFLNDPAPEDIGIIIFRNKMLYYDKEVSGICMKKLWDSLLPGGIIAIGAKEQIPEISGDKPECLNAKEKIFKKHGFEINWNNE